MVQSVRLALTTSFRNWFKRPVVSPNLLTTAKLAVGRGFQPPYGYTEYAALTEPSLSN